MKLYARTQPLGRYPVLDCLRVIRRLGYDGAEICLENEDLRPGVLTPELAEQVRAEARSLGFGSWSVSYHQDFLYNDERFEETLQAIAWTPAFGTDVFVFSGTKAHEDDPDPWGRMRDRTRELAEAAEVHGVLLAEEFEPNFIVGCTQDLLRLFAEVPSPTVCANLDLGHVFLCDPDPVAAIHSLGERIVHGHVEGMARGVHRHLMPQAGDMDLPAYLQALADVRFDGGLALDLYGVDYEAASAEVVPFLRGLLAGLRAG